MTSPFSVSAADNLNYFSFASAAQRITSTTFRLLRPPSGKFPLLLVYSVRPADSMNQKKFISSAGRTE